MLEFKEPFVLRSFVVGGGTLGGSRIILPRENTVRNGIQIPHIVVIESISLLVDIQSIGYPAGSPVFPPGASEFEQDRLFALWMQENPHLVLTVSDYVAGGDSNPANRLISRLMMIRQSLPYPLVLDNFLDFRGTRPFNRGFIFGLEGGSAADAVEITIRGHYYYLYDEVSLIQQSRAEILASFSQGFNSINNAIGIINGKLDYITAILLSGNFSGGNPNPNPNLNQSEESNEMRFPFQLNQNNFNTSSALFGQDVPANNSDVPIVSGVARILGRQIREHDIVIYESGFDSNTYPYEISFKYVCISTNSVLKLRLLSAVITQNNDGGVWHYPYIFNGSSLQLAYYG